MGRRDGIESHLHRTRWCCEDPPAVSSGLQRRGELVEVSDSDDGDDIPLLSVSIGLGGHIRLPRRLANGTCSRGSERLHHGFRPADLRPFVVGLSRWVVDPATVVATRPIQLDREPGPPRDSRGDAADGGVFRHRPETPADIT